MGEFATYDHWMLFKTTVCQNGEVEPSVYIEARIWMGQMGLRGLIGPIKTVAARAAGFHYGLLEGKASGIGREMVIGSGRRDAGGTGLRLASCGLGARRGRNRCCILSTDGGAGRLVGRGSPAGS